MAELANALPLSPCVQVVAYPNNWMGMVRNARTISVTGPDSKT